MSDFPIEQPFVLQCQVDPQSQMVIQASPDAGGGLTLQPFDPSFKTLSQQFVLRMQNNDSKGAVFASGPAFVNLGSLTPNLKRYNSVQGPTNGEPLVMEPWVPSSDTMDAWSLAHVGGATEAVRIVQSANPQLSWNDWGGHGKKDDPIYLWSDETSVNSTWSVIFVPRDKTFALPVEQRFSLISTIDSANAISANPEPGQGLTLALEQPDSALQQFVLRMQNNTNQSSGATVTGMSLVNVGSTACPSVFNSVVNPYPESPVFLEPWVPGSMAPDAWLPMYQGQGIRIVQASVPGFSWNDWGGLGLGGDPIYINSGGSPNSVWAVKLL